jgi:hypothetical protein
MVRRCEYQIFFGAVGHQQQCGAYNKTINGKPDPVKESDQSHKQGCNAFPVYSWADRCDMNNMLAWQEH